MMYHGMALIITLFLSTICCNLAMCEEPSEKEGLKAMKGRASALRYQSDKLKEILQVNPIPLYRFSDAARKTNQGTLWLWESGSEPLGVLCLFHRPSVVRKWNYELTLLSDGPANVSGRPGWSWNPARHERKWYRMKGPRAATRKSLRLTQLKSLAREFVVTEPHQGNFPLRMLSQPVHRYSRQDDDVIDGALFLFVFETDPEVVLQLEAIGGNTPGWRAAFARVAASELRVSHKKTPIWTAGPIRGWNPKHPYFSHAGPDPLKTETD